MMIRHVAALGTFLLLGSQVAFAQERGQYIPGFQGLNSGVQAPAGFTYMNALIWYPANNFNDAKGKPAPVEFDLDLVADFNALTYTTGTKILGAKLGMTVLVPVVSTAVSLPRLGDGINPWGIGDLYVEPIGLGWNLKRADIKAAYGFVAPTGKYDEDGTDTTTTDYWGHQLTLNITQYLTANKLTQLSVATNWEFHTTKRHEDVKVGNNVNIDFALGKTFVHKGGRQLFQFGVAGYAQFQLSEDSGADAIAADRLGKDRVFAIGPEAGLILPASKLNFTVRALPEFGAHSRTEGVTVLLAAGKGF